LIIALSRWRYWRVEAYDGARFAEVLRANCSAALDKADSLERDMARMTANAVTNANQITALHDALAAKTQDSIDSSKSYQEEIKNLGVAAIEVEFLRDKIKQWDAICAEIEENALRSRPSNWAPLLKRLLNLKSSVVVADSEPTQA